MKTIVLAEKPSVGKELSRILECQPKGKSYCEGNKYIVTWAMGHLVELADPGVYNEKWNSWNIDDLPMLPDKMKHKVIGKTHFQFNAIKNLFQRKDVTNLIIATDAGREGELVARWIIKLAGWKSTFSRLWISSQTDKAIKEGFNNLKKGEAYDNLFYAAESRAEADWIIGLNVTRALACKYDAKLSAGRVQTPTLAMIVDRENQIKSFIAKPYWTIQIIVDGFKAIWQGKNGVTRFNEQINAQKIVDKITDKPALISSVEINEKSEAQPLGYNLNDLQRDANKFIGFSAKQTLSVLQGLYEHHKIVTYPRTDSRHITTDMVPTLKERLKAIENTQYSSKIKELLKKEINPGKRFVDNSKVSDHHAIIPTEEAVKIDRLSREEKLLWELIVKRFIAVLSEPYKFKSIKLNIDIDNENFIAKGIETVDAGWKSIYGVNSYDSENDDDIPIQNLKKYSKGDKLNVQKISLIQGMTKPPARYTEGTLLEAMENAGKFIEDKELKESIQKGGIGTPATRADIIEKLFSNYYIERNGKELIPTPMGFELIEIVPEVLRSPELTAKWELRLSSIAEGKEKNYQFSKDIRDNAKNLVDLIKKSDIKYQPKSNSNDSCPFCGKKLISIRNKKGQSMLVCPSRTCGFEKNQYQNEDKPSDKERWMTKKLMNKYGTNSNETQSYTLADLLKAKMDNKDKKK